MKKTRKRRLLAVTAFNLLLLLALLELTGLVDYFARTGELYYLSRAQAELLPAFRGLDRQTLTHRVHPYFGFVAAPSPFSSEVRAARGIEQNNYGFDSPHAYPYRPRNERELVVGVFGGSVAAKLERFERGRKILGARLAAAFGRRSSDVTVLNFAQGGFKQPQQLLIYSYFRALGQRLDVVLNIDGFNEIALAAGNVRMGVAVDMPSMEHLASLQQVVGDVLSGHSETGYLKAMVSVRESFRRYSRMHDRALSGEAWELSFAGGFFLDRKLTKLFRKRFRSELLAYQAQSAARGGDSWLYVHPLPSFAAASPAHGPAAVVELWANTSLMMHAMQSRSRGFYFHFVQPNQYHPTGKVFGERERAIAFAERSPYAEPIRRGYPRLRQEVARLKASGVPVWDLSELFDDLEAEAYVDNCCHYTGAGQEALAKAIADAVSLALTAPESAPAARLSAHLR